MAVTRKTSHFGEGAMAYSVDYFWKIRKQKTSIRAKHTSTFCNVGAEEWLLHNFGELSDSASSEPYASTSESDSDDFDCGALMDQNDQRDHLSKHVHQPQHRRGLKGQIDHGRITGGRIHKLRGVKQIVTLRGGRVSESHHRSHLSIAAALVLPVHQMSKRSHPFTDEASKFTSASSKSKLVGTRVRHTKISVLIKTKKSAIQCQKSNKSKPSIG